MDLADGFCSFQFLYQHCGNSKGFEIQENGLCNKGNRTKWEMHRGFDFTVAFLGTLVFSREDRNIDLRLAGVVLVLTTQDKRTLIPMIVLDIFRASTSCKAEAKFFRDASYCYKCG